jgi:hypothetical protein
MLQWLNFLDIIYIPNFFLFKAKFWSLGSSLRPQVRSLMYWVQSTKLVPISGSIRPNREGFLPEDENRLRNAVLNKKRYDE